VSIEARLTGGSPRSLGRTEEVVADVLADRGLLDELFECLFNADEIVRMRAADAIEKVCRQHPDWVLPFVDRLLDEGARIEQPSVQWHLAQMLGEVSLTGSQRAAAVAILRRNLEQATDWIVLNYTLAVFATFVRDDPSLREFFTGQLRRHQAGPLKSVRKRATTLLAEFDPQ